MHSLGLHLDILFDNPKSLRSKPLYIGFTSQMELNTSTWGSPSEEYSASAHSSSFLTEPASHRMTLSESAN